MVDVGCQAAIKSDAVAAAEEAIDRALAAKRVSSEDIALEILCRADLAGDELTSSIKAFVDSHLGPHRQLTLRLA
jgi:hypothetical protein